MVLLDKYLILYVTKKVWLLKYKIIRLQKADGRTFCILNTRPACQTYHRTAYIKKSGWPPSSVERYNQSATIPLAAI